VWLEKYFSRGDYRRQAKASGPLIRTEQIGADPLGQARAVQSASTGCLG